MNRIYATLHFYINKIFLLLLSIPFLLYSCKKDEGPESSSGGTSNDSIIAMYGVRTAEYIEINDNTDTEQSSISFYNEYKSESD